MDIHNPQMIIDTWHETELPVGKIDIQGLSIIVQRPGTNLLENSSSSSADKKKSRSKNTGLELLSNADLRLKAGVHYGLVGRNGSGKSSMYIDPNEHFKAVDQEVL
jgi:ABC-type multidrug transport system fused ATPase/permease subunit